MINKTAGMHTSVLHSYYYIAHVRDISMQRHLGAVLGREEIIQYDFDILVIQTLSQTGF